MKECKRCGRQFPDDFEGVHTCHDRRPCAGATQCAESKQDDILVGILVKGGSITDEAKAAVARLNLAVMIGACYYCKRSLWERA